MGNYEYKIVQVWEDGGCTWKEPTGTNPEETVDKETTLNALGAKGWETDQVLPGSETNNTVRNWFVLFRRPVEERHNQSERAKASTRI